MHIRKLGMLHQNKVNFSLNSIYSYKSAILGLAETVSREKGTKEMRSGLEIFSKHSV